MKISDLIKELNLTLFCGETFLDREITGGYTCDMLSDVMGNIDPGMIWITMQMHANVLAIASLKDLSAVLLVNGASPDENTLLKGQAEEVVLVGTTLPAFEISGKIYQLLQRR